jgi:hypothetical protein
MCFAAAPEQDGRADHGRAAKHIIERPAQQRELDAAREEHRPDSKQEEGEDAGRPPERFEPFVILLRGDI